MKEKSNNIGQNDQQKFKTYYSKNLDYNDF